MKLFKKMLIIDSNPNNILQVESYLQVVTKEHDNLSERYADILISLTEAVNNAIIHGNKADEKKKVRIDLEQSRSELAVSVTDEGSGFDPNAIPDPTQPENLECCGGRGVLIMNSLADKLSYRNNGSTVEMIFTIR